MFQQHLRIAAFTEYYDEFKNLLLKGLLVICSAALLLVRNICLGPFIYYVHINWVVFWPLPPHPLFALVCFLDPPPRVANVLFSVLAQNPLPSLPTPLSSRGAYSSNNMWHLFIKRKYHKLCFVHYQLSTKNPEVRIASIGSSLSNEVEN